MRKRIGDFLLEKGVVTETQILEILKHSHKTGMRFGDAGLDLGIITREKMVEVFGPSFAVDFFHVEPEYFPKVTQDLLSHDLMLRYGALPLGFKTEHKFFRAKRMLNIGMLDPSRGDAPEKALEKLQATAAEKLERQGAGAIHGTKMFLILADQFLVILREVYGLDEAALRRLDPKDLDPTLTMFLENVN